MSKILLDEMPKTPEDCPFYIGACVGMHGCRLLSEGCWRDDNEPCEFITSKQEVIPLGHRQK